MAGTPLRVERATGVQLQSSYPFQFLSVVPPVQGCSTRGPRANGHAHLYGIGVECHLALSIRPTPVLLKLVSRAHCDAYFCGDQLNESNNTTEDPSLVDLRSRLDRPLCISLHVQSVLNIAKVSNT
ncbi:hypothetical protein TNCV_293891 [Trichonephila clavipes]|nr:hypothetical protein TNCV_293891 [Trichonephila clavipes]